MGAVFGMLTKSSLPSADSHGTCQPGQADAKMMTRTLLLSERAEAEKLAALCASDHCIAFAGHTTLTDLPALFVQAQRWTAEVLESHLAYPMLLFFRSSHDNEAWLNSFGAVMDAAVLVMSAV